MQKNYKLLDSSSAVEVKVPHKHALLWEGRKKIKQYLLVTSEMDSNAITAPIPRGYKIYEVILHLISPDIILLYEEPNRLE